MTKNERTQLLEGTPTLRDELVVEAKRQGWYVERIPIDELLHLSEEDQEESEFQVQIEFVFSLAVPEFSLQTPTKSYTLPEVQSWEAERVNSATYLFEDSNVSPFVLSP